MKRSIFAAMLLCLTVVEAFAQGPNGSNTYYRNADGKKGEALKTAMFNIIKLPSTAPIDYDGLYEGYKKTDTRADGYVRDWYSKTTKYKHVTDKAGSYSKEGDCYNREHLVPQSWFGSGVPKSDIMHVVPTDGYVNNKRGNIPLAEVAKADYVSNGGYCKRGTCKTPGYTGTVFEPNDEIKGDIARIYFYMVTAYQNLAPNWGNVFDGKTYPGFDSWYLTMLMRWSKQDPVDEVEIARNNAVYSETAQKNRNPFVDYPGLEDYVWGDKKTEAFSYDNYGGTSTYVAAPTFTPAGGTSFTESISVTINCATDGATVHYTLDGSTPTSSSTTYSGSAITLTETTTVKAIAYDSEGNSSSVATAKYTKGSEVVPSGDVFEKVTSASQLVAGQKYVLVYENGTYSLSGISSTSTKYGLHTTITRNSDANTVTITDDVKVLTLGSATNGWSFAFDDGSFLSWSSGNSLQTSSSAYSWNIDVSSGGAVVKTTGNERAIQFNTSSPRFACYSSGQQAVYLYVQQSSAPQKQDVILSFSSSSAEATLGESFAAPTLTIDPSEAESEVNYSSSDESVATVDASTGEVTLAGEGTATITASIAGSNNYNDASASYELTVTAAQGGGETEEVTATFNFPENSYGMTALSGSTSEYNPNPTTISSDNVSLTMSGDNASRYWQTSNSYELRVYKACTMTISAPENGIVTKIVFAGDAATGIQYNNSALQNKTWEGEQESVSFTFSATQKISTITVTCQVEKLPETITLTVSSVGYATTYYSDKNLVVPEGVEAYTYKVADGKLTVSTVYESGDVIPQATGVVLKAAEGSYDFEVSDEGGLVDTDNQLSGTDEPTTISDPGYKYYMLSLNAQSDPNSVGFYWGKNSENGTKISNGAHKAYLAVPVNTSATQGNAKSFFLFNEADITDAIDNVQSAEFKTQSTEIYNLNGQRVNTPQRGIYIVNGRKVVVK